MHANLGEKRREVIDTQPQALQHREQHERCPADQREQTCTPGKIQAFWSRKAEPLLHAERRCVLEYGRAFRSFHLASSAARSRMGDGRRRYLRFHVYYVALRADNQRATISTIHRKTK